MIIDDIIKYAKKTFGGVNPTTGPANISISSNLVSGSSSSGVFVTELSSLNLTTVWACAQVLAQTVSTLPVCVYERKGGDKLPRYDHPLSRMIDQRPNGEMTAQQYFSTVMLHLALWGNSYSEIERDGAGRPIAIWPIAPWRVYVRRIGGVIFYDVILVAGGTTRLAARDMLHFRGLATDGIVGLSPVRAGCEAIGLGLAAQVSAGKFFANDSHPSGILTTPGKLDGATRDRLRTAWEQGHSGLGNHHRVAILDADLKWASTAIPAVDAQLIENRRLTREDIAQMYRMPQHKVGILERSTNNNIEQQAIEFSTDTIKPWAVNLEQEIALKLLKPSETNLFVYFDLDDMLRGDAAARSAYYASGIQWGWLSPDEARARENMNAIPGGLGKVYLRPMNMVPAGTEAAPAAPKPAPEKPEIPAEEPADEVKP